MDLNVGRDKAASPGRPKNHTFRQSQSYFRRTRSPLRSGRIYSRLRSGQRRIKGRDKMDGTGEEVTGFVLTRKKQNLPRKRHRQDSSRLSTPTSRHGGNPV
jgi:hypothetical protein